MLCDPPVTHPHDIDRLEVDLAMGWSDAQERPFMRSVISLVSRHAIAIRELPVNFRMEVRERGTKIAVELPYTFLVTSRVRLWCMVNEIIGEEFFKHIEVPSALHFLGISADNSFRRV